MGKAPEKDSTPEEGIDMENMTLEEKKRAALANQIYSEACQECNIKVSSWQEFGAWREYVDGRINEAQLDERARNELKNFSSTFGKYIASEKDDSKPSNDQSDTKERARRANKIYKEVCTDAGMTACFFNRFSTWSDYVQGRISDTEFYAKAKVEIQEFVNEQNGA